jgi:hypothetical protein
LDEIHWIEVADQAEARQTWRAGMEGEGALDTIVFEEGLAACDLFEDLGWQILAVEEKAEMGFVHKGIVEQGQENVRAVVVEKGG